MSRIAWFIVLSLVLVRIPCAFTMGVDADETQHLHVVWNWSEGRLAYRDFSDNHPPLFHVLCVPLFDACGEAGRTLIIMRLAMIPLYVLTLIAAIFIARGVLRRDLVPWAAACVAAMPTAWRCSLEFRADDLWSAACVAGVAVLMGGRFSVKRAVVAGLIFGFAAGVSLKTVFFLIAMAIGGLAVLLMAGTSGFRSRARAAAGPVVSFALGFAVVPGLIIAYFASHGAFEDLRRSTFAANVIPYGAREGLMAVRPFVLPVVLLPLLRLGRAISRRTADPTSAARWTFLLGISVAYYAALVSLWPIIRRQDSLPAFPLLMIVLCGACGALGDRLARRADSPDRPALVLRRLPLLLAVLAGIVWIGLRRPYEDRIAPVVRRIDAGLRLTDRDEPVFDLKGEFVFRRRGHAPMLERVTMRRIELGLEADTLEEDLVREGVTVALDDGSRLTERGRAFLFAHYLRGPDEIRVAGAWLRPAESGGERMAFRTAIPSEYVVAVVGVPGASPRAVGGLLDGIPLIGPRRLPPGPHVFEPAEPTPPTEGRFAALAARAFARGFTPSLPSGH